MYAIIKTGGKQYKVSEGDVITVEKLAAAEGEAVTFDEVLTVVNDADVKVGKPVVEGAKVTGKVEAQGKGKKIRIFKYKAKSNYRKRQGHRQPFTKVVIENTAPRGEDIVCAGVSSLTDSAYLGITEYLHRNVISKDSSGELQLMLEGRPDERTEAILETMLLGLMEISKAYPKALRIQRNK